jgi:hypothetical protein
MRTAISILFFLLSIFAIDVSAQDVESFDEAKKLAESNGKPILMEFLRPG